MKSFHYVSILVSSLVVLVHLPSHAANMLVNPGFANSASGWSLSTGASPFNRAAHDGDGWVLMFREDQTSVGNWATASQTLAAAPNQQWTFTAWVLYPGGSFLHDGDYSVLDITFTTGSGTSSGGQSSQVTSNFPENSWRQLSVTSLAPPDTRQVTLSFKFYRADTSATGRLYYDHAFAEGIPPVPEPSVVWAALPVLIGAIFVQMRKRARRAH